MTPLKWDLFPSRARSLGEGTSTLLAMNDLLSFGPLLLLAAHHPGIGPMLRVGLRNGGLAVMAGALVRLNREKLLRAYREAGGPR